MRAPRLFRFPTNGMTFSSVVAGMTFTHKFAMEAHAVVHQSQRLRCGTCGKKFGLQRSLEQHVRLMHRETVAAAAAELAELVS